MKTWLRRSARANSTGWKKNKKGFFFLVPTVTKSSSVRLPASIGQFKLTENLNEDSRRTSKNWKNEWATTVSSLSSHHFTSHSRSHVVDLTSTDPRQECYVSRYVLFIRVRRCACASCHKSQRVRRRIRDSVSARYYILFCGTISYDYYFLLLFACRYLFRCYRRTGGRRTGAGGLAKLQNNQTMAKLVLRETVNSIINYPWQ